MRRTLLLLVLAGAAPAAEDKVKTADLPQVDRVAKMVKLTPFSRVIFELDAHGRLFHQGRPVTLNEFDKTVLRHTEERGRHLRRTPGEKGYDQLGPDIKASPVHVILRAHREAPWRHVQWLMLLMQEQRAYKAEFLARDKSGREGVVKAWLPLGKEAKDEFEISADDEEEESKPPPDQPGTVHVTILPEGARARRYAGRTVEAPAGVSWAVGRHKHAEFAELKGAIRSAHSKARSRARKPRIEIRAGSRIPYGEVVRVLALVQRGKYEHIDFAGTPIPSARERMAKTLPYPGG